MGSEAVAHEAEAFEDFRDELYIWRGTFLAADNLLATLLPKTALSRPLIPPATQVTEN